MKRRTQARRTWHSQKQRTRLFLKKAGLYKTKAQRRALYAALKQKLGYEPPRLSAQVANPSNYTRTRTKLIVGPSGQILREEFIVKRHHKGGSGKSGGGADRGISHKTGTMKAKRQAKAGTMGMRFGKEPRKKKKK